MRRAKSKTPMRRCVACRESKPQSELMRFTLSSGQLTADSGARADGRGFYLCRDRACVDEALRRKSFNRACRCSLDADDVKKAVEEAFSSI